MSWHGALLLMSAPRPVRPSGSSGSGATKPPLPALSYMEPHMYFVTTYQDRWAVMGSRRSTFVKSFRNLAEATRFCNTLNGG
jgi:hypothetical protein